MAKPGAVLSPKRGAVVSQLVPKLKESVRPPPPPQGVFSVKTRPVLVGGRGGGLGRGWWVGGGWVGGGADGGGHPLRRPGYSVSLGFRLPAMCVYVNRRYL